MILPLITHVLRRLAVRRPRKAGYKKLRFLRTARHAAARIGRHHKNRIERLMRDIKYRRLDDAALKQAMREIQQRRAKGRETRRDRKLWDALARELLSRHSVAPEPKPKRRMSKSDLEERIAEIQRKKSAPGMK